MSDNNIKDVTQALARLASGDSAASEQLYPAVYAELRRIAGRWFRDRKRDNTLQPTALVHEAYMHLVDQTQMDFRNRSHFFGVAALAMRQILVQHARRRNALKRGSDWGRITLSSATPADDSNPIDLIDLDSALCKLQALHERQARVVELRFFGELSVEETAEVLNVSPRTVKLDWRMARSWLRSTLLDGGRE